MAATLSQGSAAIMFSGADGAPLVITLTAPIVFDVNTAHTGASSAYGLLIVGAYTADQGTTLLAKTGDIQLDGSQTGQWLEGTGSMGTLPAFGAVGPRDLIIFFNNSSGSNMWSDTDTMTATAGSLTTDSNFTPPLPDATGPFTVRLVQGNNGNIIPEFDSQTVALVPEPATTSLLFLATGAFLFHRRRA
ncbi:MAG: PEP-CTERM sorting domain-containing protein [Verrucomicrobiota bacterium]